MNKILQLQLRAHRVYCACGLGLVLFNIRLWLYFFNHWFKMAIKWHFSGSYFYITELIKIISLLALLCE